MLMGIFGGVSVNALRTKVQRIQKLQSAVREDAGQALADRAAAIEEIRNEILEISSLRASVRE